MNAPAIKVSRFGLILIIISMILSTTACSMGGLSTRNGKATLDLRLSEKDISSMVIRTFSQLERDQADLLTSVSRVSIRDGYIRVYGTTINTKGKEVRGSIDVTFSVDEGQLRVQVSAVDMPGVTLDDPRFVKANRDLSRDFAQSVEESRGEFKFIRAEVLDDVVHLQIQLPG